MKTLYPIVADIKETLKKAVSKEFTIVLFFISCSSAFSQSPSWQWVSRATGSGSQELMHFNCTDQAGNIFVIGSSAGGVDLGTGKLNAGQFLAKYNEWGNILWATSLPGAAIGMGADSNGDVMVAATFSASFVHNGGNSASAGLNDICVLKFSGVGNALWIRTFGGVGNDELNAFATDLNGDCVLSGESSHSISFDQFWAGQSASRYVVKLNKSGKVQWLRTDLDLFINCMAVDRNHRIYLGGAMNISGCSMFCSRATLCMLEAGGNTIKDSLFAKGEMSIWDLTVDSDLNIITIQNSGVNTSHTSKLMKLDTTWKTTWSKTIAANYVGHWLGQGLCTDSQNNIYTAGVCGFWYGKDSTVFDSVWMKSSGKYDVELVLMKLEPTKGSLSWLITAGGKGNDGSDHPTTMSGDLAVDPIGNLYLASSFHHMGNGDYVPITDDTCYFGNKYLTSVGEFSQLFLAKYGSDRAVIGIEEQTVGSFSTVYPIPSGGFIYFKMRSSEKVDVRVFKSDGSLVSVFNVDSNFFGRDLSYLGPGVYWLEMQAGSRIERKVILLQE